MADIRLRDGTILTVAPDYKPGDREPIGAGYLDWHEWAEVQHQAGLRQVECVDCGKWWYPQDLHPDTVIVPALTRRGKPTQIECRRCMRCADARADPKTPPASPGTADLASPHQSRDGITESGETPGMT